MSPKERKELYRNSLGSTFLLWLYSVWKIAINFLNFSRLCCSGMSRPSSLRQAFHCEDCEPLAFAWRNCNSHSFGSAVVWRAPDYRARLSSLSGSLLESYNSLPEIMRERKTAFYFNVVRPTWVSDHFVICLVCKPWECWPNKSLSTVLSLFCFVFHKCLAQYHWFNVSFYLNYPFVCNF